MHLAAATKHAPPKATTAPGLRAFTLAEMMVSVLIFSMIILAMIGVWLFCLRWDELVCSKVGASDKSRMSFDQLTGDIRAAKWWRIGSATNAASFVACTNLMDQVGNALKLCDSGDTNSTAWTVYFFNTNHSNSNYCWLCRETNGVSKIQIIAQNLTNTGLTPYSMTFTAQQFNGNLAQDLQYKYAIVTTMEFAQYQYPLTVVGPGYYYNYYRIQLKAASHCPN
ncbi:MAG TPA: prepilin-type N-terminal cleavage/methylation domain-containing protein [Candidatus Acidoferrum sp.]|nr:prepilin-type N-terminal cleavage/methylation domain-containing protein [Candidatus Acidoferrum sp.]